MAALSLYHWKLKVPVPVAVTTKLAVPPVATVCATGCVVIKGEPSEDDTVRVATELVTLPESLDTTTS